MCGIFDNPAPIQSHGCQVEGILLCVCQLMANLHISLNDGDRICLQHISNVLTDKVGEYHSNILLPIL